MNRLRVFLAYALGVACILNGGLQVFIDLRAASSAGTPSDIVSPWEEHLQPLRQSLPATVQAAGYVDASDIPGSSASRDEAELGLSQYALAPIVLRPGLEGTWIIGNFGASASLETIRPWLSRTLGAFTIQRFGYGLYLIHVTGQ